MTRELPMFPLGTVLFPHAFLPLHVFEPRYRELTRTCLAGEREFGVVLIERGSEVGGGDTRFRVGCRARIVQAAELPDGRWVLATVGAGRVRVASWLPEKPYPRAEVDDIEDVSAGPELDERRNAAERLLRRALALKAELGEPAPPAVVELSGDPTVAAWQLAALAPIGPADAQRVLEADGPAARLVLLAALLDDEVGVLARRAGGG